MSAAGSHRRSKIQKLKRDQSDDSISHSSFKSQNSRASYRWHGLKKKQQKSETTSLDLDEIEDEEQQKE